MASTCSPPVIRIHQVTALPDVASRQLAHALLSPDPQDLRTVMLSGVGARTETGAWPASGCSGPVVRPAEWVAGRRVPCW